MFKIINGIGQRLRLERERLGLTQAQLGVACGVSLLTEHKYEHEQTSPTARYLVAAQTCGVDPTAVLFGEIPVATSLIDWDLVRDCRNDVDQYCSLYWQDCPDTYRWSMTKRLYEKYTADLTVPKRKADRHRAIKDLLGV